MRDFVVLAIVYGSLPIIPFRPFLGLCVFSWFAYMRPQNLAWSLQGTNLALMVMGATVLGVTLHLLFPKALGPERAIRFHSTTVMMIALGLWVAVTAQTAIEPELSKSGVFSYYNFEKTLFFALLTTGLVSSFVRFRVLVAVIAFSFGLLGFKYALFGILRGGTEILHGPGTMDRNGFALLLNMAIPLLMAVGTSERSRSLRYAALALIPATAITIIFCFSRGGYLTLGLVACAIVLRSGKPWLAVLMLIVGISAFTVVTGRAFRESAASRTSSIQTYEQDASAAGRIAEWKTAIRIFNDYPVFGIGRNNLRAIHSKYSTYNYYKVTHNSFLQLLVDSGLPALVLLLLLLLSSLWKLEKLRWAPGVPKIVANYAGNFQISFAAYLLGGSLLNYAYCELMYQVLALTVSLELLARSTTIETPSLKLVTAEPDHWWKRQPSS